MVHTAAIGTDIAMLGVWDAQHARSDMASMPHAEMEEALRADARGGRLFFLNTGADGACDIQIYVDEPVPSSLLRHYKTLNKQFLLRIPSGRLVADGVEQYMGSAVETDESGEFLQIQGGDYLLQLHELSEGDITDPAHLSVVVGEEDHAYFQTCNRAPRAGCGLLASGILFLLFSWWIAGAPLLALGLGLLLYRAWRNNADERYQRVKEQILAYQADFPLLIFSLVPVEDDAGLEGGWHNLEAI